IELESSARLRKRGREGQSDLWALVEGEHADGRVLAEMIKEGERRLALARYLLAEAARSIEREQERDARRARGEIADGHGLAVNARLKVRGGESGHARAMRIGHDDGYGDEIGWDDKLNVISWRWMGTRGGAAV